MVTSLGEGKLKMGFFFSQYCLKLLSSLNSHAFNKIIYFGVQGLKLILLYTDLLLIVIIVIMFWTLYHPAFFRYPLQFIQQSMGLYSHFAIHA